MDRSRRATNPQNYNDNGTVKKGKKTWNYSNHYKKLKAKHAELCRINATNRRLAINEDVNHLRSIGDVFITEPKNAAKLMKRAKETTVNNKGKINRKKRFGKSVKNRCPGGFQTAVENKFKTSGGTYIEVPNNYRASSMITRQMITLKRNCLTGCINLQTGHWYKGTGIPHSCCTATITEPMI